MRHAKFIMLEHIDSHAYKLDIFSRINNIFHTWLLRPVADDSFPNQRRADWQPPTLIANDDRKEYKIEVILNEYCSGRFRPLLGLLGGSSIPAE